MRVSLGRSIGRSIPIALLTMVLPLVGMHAAQAARVKTLRVSDASIIEGDAGPAKSMSFKISWTGSKGGGPVQVHYATADVTATAGSDYTAKSGTASISNGGCRCVNVAVPVLGDTLAEGTETLQVNLSSPVSAVIGDGQGIGTIYDNEGPPSLVALDTAVDESGNNLQFSVQLTSGSLSTVTVDYATADGTALAGSDYTATSGTLTFTSGQTVKTINVPVNDDALNEDDETVFLNLTNPSGAPTDDASATGTIIDNDAEPDISIANATVAEGDAASSPASFTISLSAASGRDVEVDYTTTDGTALAGQDYTATSGTALIAAGATTAQVDVAVSGDTTYEPNESFTLDLSNPANANIVDASGAGTITNDDPVPALSIDDVAVTEGNAGSSDATFTASLTNPSAADIHVDWATSDGSATAGSDYQAGNGALVITAGSTSAQIPVQVLGDTTDEPNEQFTVTLTNPSGATISDPSGTGTIHDDDKTRTALTARVKKGRHTIAVKGLIEPATAGLKITVAVSRRKGAKYVLVGRRTVSVKAIKDRDHDGRPDGAYVVKLKRPKRGAYRAVVTFAGTADLAKTRRALRFKL